MTDPTTETTLDPVEEYLDAERPVGVEEDVDPEAPSDAPPVAVPDAEREEPDLENPSPGYPLE